MSDRVIWPWTERGEEGRRHQSFGRGQRGETRGRQPGESYSYGAVAGWECSTKCNALELPTNRNQDNTRIRKPGKRESTRRNSVHEKKGREREREKKRGRGGGYDLAGWDTDHRRCVSCKSCARLSLSLSRSLFVTQFTHQPGRYLPLPPVFKSPLSSLTPQSH